MQISMQLNYTGDYRKAVDTVVAYEKAGLDLVWVAELYGYDGVSVCGYLAAKTETITIASGIFPIYSRTPTLMASTAMGIDALSGGRFELGLGASGPQVIEGWHGVPYDKPLTRTREMIDICRKVWAREEKLTYDGKAYTLPLPPEQGTGLGKPLKSINRAVRPDIPIWIASLGPKNVELTAAEAEGWLPIFFMPEKADDVFGEAVAAGKAKRAPERGELRIAAGGMLSIGNDAKGALEFARPMMALYVGGMGAKGKNFYNELVSRYGYEEEAEKIQDLYLDGHKEEAAGLIPDELLDRTNLCGDEGWIKERIQAYKEAGVTHLNVIPIGDPVELIGKVKAWAE